MGWGDGVMMETVMEGMGMVKVMVGAVGGEGDSS